MDKIIKCVICKKRNGINYTGEYICTQCWNLIRLKIKEYKKIKMEVK